MSFFNVFISRKAIRIYTALVLFLVLCVVCDRAILPWYVNLGGVVKVPNVIGLKEKDAYRILQQSNLIPIESGRRFDDKFSEGMVIFESPLPHENVREGRRIYLTISGGEEVVEVPDFVGRSLRDAKISLINANLRLGNLTYDSTNITETEMVLNQGKPKGTKAKPGTYISLVLSIVKTTPLMTVPNLVNMSLNEARTKLASCNLNVGKIHYKSISNLNPNTVFDQFPKSGEPATEGKEIDIWVSTDEENETN